LVAIEEATEAGLDPGVLQHVAEPGDLGTRCREILARYRMRPGPP